MKKFISIIAIVLSFSGFAQRGCNNNAPGWGMSLGTITFDSRGHNVVIQGTGRNAHIHQTWSGAVTAVSCQKTSFDGGRRADNTSADCRSNPGFPGDLFTWCAVVRFADRLCPHPWRVPTQQDFIDLDRVLGGTGNARTATTQFVTNNYLNRWLGTFGGFSRQDGRLQNQGSWGGYWARTDSDPTRGDLLGFGGDGGVDVNASWDKRMGLTLRCVQTRTLVTDAWLSISATTLIVGNTLRLNVSIIPNNATNQNVSWRSSNPRVATVSSNGLVTAVSRGTATITVTTEDGRHTATSTITVAPFISVSGLTLYPATDTLFAGESDWFTATVQPSNATNQNVTWHSSNPKVVTVNSRGLVTAVSVGTTTIIATTEAGDHTASSSVTVAPIPVRGVSFHPATRRLFVGNTEQFYATVQPSNATNQNVTWHSSNPAIARVNSQGLITAVSIGTTTITVTTQDGNHIASGSVTVTPTSVIGIVLSPATVTLSVGHTRRLTASVQPTNATNRNVSWSSSNPAVARVDDNGLVTAISHGTARVTATTEDGRRTATSTITVPVSVTGIDLSPNRTRLAIGDTRRLEPTVRPTNATNRNVSWQSSNPAVARVSFGLVTAVAPGTATITATTQDGNHVASSTIRVPNRHTLRQLSNLSRNLNAHFWDVLGAGYEYNRYGGFFSMSAVRYHNRFFNIGVGDVGLPMHDNNNDLNLFVNWLDIGVGLPLVTDLRRRNNPNWMLKTSVNWGIRTSFYSEYRTFFWPGSNPPRRGSYNYEWNRTATTLDLRVDFLLGGPLTLTRAFAKIDTDRYISFGVSFNLGGLFSL